MNIKIRNYLLSLGFYPNKKGYYYLLEIIRLGLKGNTILPLKYYGYKKLAETFNKKAETIEKDIQNVISYAFQHGNLELLYEEFGETIDVDRGKPSNKQFILTAIEQLSCSEKWSVGNC